jgi:endonuclease YncB( thermonuclease family)
MWKKDGSAASSGADALLLGVAALLVMLVLLAGVAIRSLTRLPLEALAPHSPAVAARTPPASESAPRRELVVLRPSPPRPLSGAARVVDTGAIELAGEVLRLRGVRGIDGAPADAFADWLAGRPVECWPAVGGRYVCEAAGVDLAEVVLFNGGGRATADAPFALRRAEREARDARRGVWATQPARLAPGAPRR